MNFEESSDNVLADTGLENAETLLLRVELGHSVRMIMEQRRLMEGEISRLLEITRPEVARLMNGRYTGLSQERLMGFLNKLDQRVIVKIAPRQKGERWQEVIFDKSPKSP